MLESKPRGEVEHVQNPSIIPPPHFIYLTLSVMMVMVVATLGAGRLLSFFPSFSQFVGFRFWWWGILTYLSLYIFAIKLLSYYSPNTILDEVHDIIACLLWQLCLWLFCLLLAQFYPT